MAVTPYVVADPDTGGDVFAPGDPPHGVCWSPDDPALEEDPTWVRLDDPAGIRVATGFQIVRGRSSETDRTATGTATVTFTDTEGILDPTNPSSPFWDSDVNDTLVNPMKQAAIALRNPVTGDWHTLFRGFLAGPNHDLDMFTETRGLDQISWSLVDAFDVFANVILTPGKHGDPLPSLTSFPNVYYAGTTHIPEEDTTFKHVDDRIIQLLDDAGWPGTGLADAPLRRIFSGNVSCQGVVYSRKDSLLSALFDACDAEFPGGVSTVFVSKTGVVTFHGRYARFFPERPGYGINQWYVGSLTDASLDPDVAPVSGPIRFYRAADDIVNACLCLPQQRDENTAGVVFQEDTDSINTYGYRSLNFNDLLVSEGHDDDGNTTDDITEANKFSEFFVKNLKDPKTRVATLRFHARGADAVGAPALWRLMTEVELGDVVTLTTAHAGGGGFGEDFFVEQIRYSAEPAREDMLNITLELEVSPKTFFDWNPFGELDLGES